MTKPCSSYQAETPRPSYDDATSTIGLSVDNRAACVSYADVRRRALLQELKELEEGWLDYGRGTKLTTSRLRELWQQWRGRCPHCGKGLGE